MAILQVANSKSVVKKLSNNDIPQSILNPVINRYESVSTAAQSVINLNFSIITSGPNAQTDAFFLIIDGKTFRMGSGHDFTFTNINANLSSSQVTLNVPLSSGLNIIAVKLGLKSEVENGMDSRFTQLYEYLGDGFQGFINPNEFLLTPTTTPGTPAAGTFYSTISKRASIMDLSQDLKPRMGIERIMIQNIMQLQNEFGPNGEPVFGVVNDTLGLIRCVGSGWTNNITTGSGVNIFSTNVNDYTEITFYGTGINLIGFGWNDARDVRASVDGGAEGLNLLAGTSTSIILPNRNYNTNQIYPALAGLSLGIHTVKLRANLIAITLYGFEILNESSNIKTNSGVGYIKGQKIINPSQSSVAYNSGFDGSPTLNGRGGRVLQYLNIDGTIKKAIQQVNASAAYLGSADHTNEEVARTYHWREFGAGRSDDFSLATGAAGARAFTLDDGTSTLVADAITINTEAIYPTAANNYITLTFIGTGLDTENVRADGATLGSTTIFVNGTSQGTLPADTNIRKKTVKLCSGLPYGTHTIKIRFDSGNTYFYSKFIVYQPKKPSLPSGCIELGEYNLMADYSATGTATSENISIGTLLKGASREMVYVGTWVAALDATILGGFTANSSTATNYFEYTFFGSGLDIVANSVGSTTVTLQIDGAAYTGAATAIGASASWVGGTSTWTVSNTKGGRLQISGLVIGSHKVRVTIATGSFYLSACTIICPINSYKSNINADYQNTLSIGSNSISDNRALTLIKDSNLQRKNWAQALGITSSPTTTSTSLVPCPDMSCTIKTNGGDLDIAYSILSFNATAGAFHQFQIYVNGIAIGNLKATSIPVTGNTLDVSDSFRIPLANGTHKIDLYWATNAGTATAYATNRNLKVQEV